MKKTSQVKIFLTFLFIALLLGGCAGKNINNNQNKNDNQNQAQINSPEIRIIENENFTKGTKEDLQVGKMAIIIGEENETGLVVSKQIIIGEEDDFSFMGIGFGMGSSTDRRFGTSTLNKQNSDENIQFNREQFQNMSDEERAEFREQMMRDRGGVNNENSNWRGNRGNTELSEEERARFTEMRNNRQQNGVRRMARSGASRIRGEIISVEDSSITVKLGDEGSRLVFYTDSTIINIIIKDNDK